VLLHRAADALAAGHAEPEPAEGVLGKPAARRRHVRRAAGKIQDERQRSAASVRGGYSAAGGQHALVAADRPEHRAVRAGRVRRVLERPTPKASAVHAHTRR